MSVGIIAYYQRMQVCQVKVFISILNIYWRCWISLYVNLGFFIQIPYSVLVAFGGSFVIPLNFHHFLQNLEKECHTKRFVIHFQRQFRMELIILSGIIICIRFRYLYLTRGDVIFIFFMICNCDTWIGLAQSFLFFCFAKQGSAKFSEAKAQWLASHEAMLSVWVIKFLFIK